MGGARYLGQDVGLTVVDDRVDRIEPQPVEVVLLEPVECVVYVKVADIARAGRVEIDGRSPRRVMPVREELRRVEVQVVTFRAEVVVDDVEHHGDTTSVSRGDEGFQLLRPAVGGLRSELQHTVIAPAALARKIGDRHELDGGDTQPSQVVELIFHAREGAFRAERADVQLVDNGLMPRPAAPLLIVPLESLGVDDLAGSLNVVGIAPGGGVGHLGLPVDPVAVPAAGVSLTGDELEPPARLRTHFERARLAGLLVEHQLDLMRSRRPEAKADVAFGRQLRPKGHVMATAGHQ